jgi:hypothetical protein
VLVLLVAGTAAATGGHSPLMVVPIVVAVLVPLIIMRIQRRGWPSCPRSAGSRAAAYR